MRVFYSGKARCSKNYAVRGSGGKIGPDLSNLTSRDYTSVKRDSDHTNATLKDGRQFSAEMRDDAGEVVLGLGAGVEMRMKHEVVGRSL